MTPVTRAPEAKTYLLAQLRLLPAFAGVTVKPYPMTDADETGQNFYVDTVEFTQSFRGISSRNDDFTINCAFIVRQRGSIEAIEARAWEILGAVQTFVGADPSLGGILNAAAEVTGGIVQTYPAGPTGEWGARGTIRVRGTCVLPD